MVEGENELQKKLSSDFYTHAVVRITHTQEIDECLQVFLKEEWLSVAAERPALQCRKARKK